MNKPFDQLMKTAALISIAIAAVSALLVFSYLDSKDLAFKDIFNEGSFSIGIRDNPFLNDMDDSNVRHSQSTSRYDTKTLIEDDVFDVVENIQINTSIEDIVFIHESREDIRVSFEREVPDTTAYAVTYKARSTENQIIVDVKMRTNGLYTDRDYKGLVTIYLPENYEGDKLIIKSNVASHDMSLPKNIDHVEISVNFGSMDMTIDQPLDSLILSINAGDLNFETNEHVAHVEASVDTGELSFDVRGQVGNFSAENNVGEIKGFLKFAPTAMDVRCNLGDVALDFADPVKTLSADLNLGDLSIDVSDDDASIVYIDTDLVDYRSVLKTSKKETEANVFVEMNVGSVVIK